MWSLEGWVYYISGSSMENSRTQVTAQEKDTILYVWFYMFTSTVTVVDMPKCLDYSVLGQTSFPEHIAAQF